MTHRSTRLPLLAVMTALMCIAGPLTLPIGPVPVSLLSAVVMLAAMLLGGRMAAASCGAYLLLGMVGLPVFGGFTGGVGHFAGPTGGFLAGYLPLALIAGAVCSRTDSRLLQGLSLAGGTAALYGLGTAWYCLQAGVSIPAALAVCVLPFLPFDAMKLALVLMVGPRLRRALT